MHVEVRSAGAFTNMSPQCSFNIHVDLDTFILTLSAHQCLSTFLAGSSHSWRPRQIVMPEDPREQSVVDCYFPTENISRPGI